MSKKALPFVCVRAPFQCPSVSVCVHHRPYLSRQKNPMPCPKEPHIMFKRAPYHVKKSPSVCVCVHHRPYLPGQQSAKIGSWFVESDVRIRWLVCRKWVYITYKRRGGWCAERRGRISNQKADLQKVMYKLLPFVCKWVRHRPFRSRPKSPTMSPTMRTQFAESHLHHLQSPTEINSRPVKKSCILCQKEPHIISERALKYVGWFPWATFSAESHLRVNSQKVTFELISGNHRVWGGYD